MEHMVELKKERESLSVHSDINVDTFLWYFFFLQEGEIRNLLELLITVITMRPSMVMWAWEASCL